MCGTRHTVTLHEPRLDRGVHQISGGVFARNKADYGGFLYKVGVGNTICSNATIEGNVGVDGGAIYAVDGAIVDWECDLVENTALTAPAM